MTPSKRRSTLTGASETIRSSRFKFSSRRVANARDTAILELFYATGLRLSELIALNIEDLALIEETIRVMGKGQKERILPLGECAIEAIKRYRAVAHIEARPPFISNLPQPIASRSVWLSVK